MESDFGCQIVTIGRRRNGRLRHWCLKHRADATAKHGKQASECRASRVPPLRPEEQLKLDIDRYAGGIAIWGALPPVYDTTRLAPDVGVHVHAREGGAEEKAIDESFRLVRLLGRQFQGDVLKIRSSEAYYYTATTILGLESQSIHCTVCGELHLDKDWFSVNPHRQHLCLACGKYFFDMARAIGNPICEAVKTLPKRGGNPIHAQEDLDIRQADFRGGLQIWGSNPAILWTREKSEEEGIHVHAFSEAEQLPIVDETYARVRIDGIDLDPELVRRLMAQQAIPHISNRVVSITCTACGLAITSTGKNATVPTILHTCSSCGTSSRRFGRLKKTIANPMVDVFERLAASAPRTPQVHSVTVLPELL